MRLSLVSCIAALVSVCAAAQHHAIHAAVHHRPHKSANMTSSNETSLTDRELHSESKELGGPLIEDMDKRAFVNSRATYFAVGLGACGHHNSSGQFLVALNHVQFDVGGGYPGPMCFRKLNISYKGRSAVATVEDRCPGCPYGGLDMSEGLFTHLAGGTGPGVIYVTWEWAGSGGGGSDPPKTTSTPKPPPPSSTRTTSTTSRRPSSTQRPTSSTTHTSQHSSSHSSSTRTTTTTTSTSSTPTPTETEPAVSNLADLLQAALGMTHLMEAAALDTNAEATV